MWKSFGHLIASIAQKILSINTAVQKEAPVIEGVTGTIPVYGPEAVTIEQAGFMVLGEVAAAIKSGFGSQLQAAGIAPNVIATAEAVGTAALGTIATALPAAVPSTTTAPAASAKE